MNSQNGFNSYNNRNQYNPDYNNLNNNYCEQYNNNYSYQNNYNYPQYNNNNINQYGNIVRYYNNYPVYSYIPPSFPQQNNNEIKENTEKEQKKDKQIKRGILLNLKKQDMCFLRPPEYQPGYLGQAYGKPKYIENPPK